MTRTTARVFGVGLGVVISSLAGPVEAQLVGDRFAVLPAQAGLGVGRVRLAGMGGFFIAVADENNEISLYDFSANPAGYADDRDSWSIDVRYSHMEFVQGPTSLAGNDVKINDGTFVLGYHNPGKFGIGGTIDYSEAAARDAAFTEEAYQVAGFHVVSSLYIFPKLVAGIEVGYSGETQDVSSQGAYIIEHDASVPHVGGGVGMMPLPGLTLGARADAYPTSIDGISQSSTHEDAFTWDRPATAWSAHGFLDRGRLELAADYSRRDVEGKESVQLSWSERFQWNPTPNTLNLETDTFSEDRQGESFRTRARLEVMPRLALSGTYATFDESFKIISNPNALGSLSEGAADASSDAWLLGASYSVFQSRLLVAGELGKSTRDFARTSPVTGLTESSDVVVLRLGGEYFIGEKLAVRGGVIREDENRETLVSDGPGVPLTVYPELTGSFDSWRLATGLGLVPWGAIWEVDVAYEVTLQSDLEDDLSHFAVYVRYLF